MQNNQNTQNLYLQGLSVQDLKELLTDLFQTNLGLTNSEIPANSKIAGNRISFTSDDHFEDGKPTYITRGQVAKMLQISLPTLHNYVKQGLIKSYRIGGKVRFILEDLQDALIERNFTTFNRKGGQNVA
jgi:excisionase family DNA binding protein